MKQSYFILFLIVITSFCSAQDQTSAKLSTTNKTEIFTLYPNPVYKGIVYIKSNSKSPKEVFIYDVFGEVVFSKRVTNNSLDVSRLISGVYVVTITQNQKSTSRKLVVK